MVQAARIAKLAYDRVEDQIDSAPLPQAVVTAGVFTDKLQLLSGDATAHAFNLNVKMVRNRFSVACERFNWLVAEVEAKTKAVMKENELLKERAASQLQLPPPNSETISDPTAGNGFAAGEGNAKKISA